MSPGTMGVQIHTEWGPKASLISSWPPVTRPVWVLPHPHPQPPRGLCSLHPNQVWMSYFWLGFLPFWLVFGTFWQLLFFTCKIKRCFIILAGFWNFLHLFGNFFFLSLLMFSQHFGTFRPSLAIYEDFCYSYGSSISDTVTSTKTSNSSKAPKVSASRKASSTSSLPEATTDGKSESRNHLT